MSEAETVSTVAQLEAARLVHRHGSVAAAVAVLLGMRRMRLLDGTALAALSWLERLQAAVEVGNPSQA